MATILSTRQRPDQRISCSAVRPLHVASVDAGNELQEPLVYRNFCHGASIQSGSKPRHILGPTGSSVTSASSSRRKIARRPCRSVAEPLPRRFGATDRPSSPKPYGHAALASKERRNLYSSLEPIGVWCRIPCPEGPSTNQYIRYLGLKVSMQEAR